MLEERCLRHPRNSCAETSSNIVLALLGTQEGQGRSEDSPGRNWGSGRDAL